MRQLDEPGLVERSEERGAAVVEAALEAAVARSFRNLADLNIQLRQWLDTVANACVSDEMVRDLMVAAVEQRFGATQTRHPVGWLSDNGSAYIAKATADLARAIGLKMLFTPVRSPESNGMSESFVKTLKRDYARLNVLTDVAAILAMLPDWIEGYCEVHPHSGLKFRSPREFILLNA